MSIEHFTDKPKRVGGSHARDDSRCHPRRRLRSAVEYEPCARDQATCVVRSREDGIVLEARTYPRVTPEEVANRPLVKDARAGVGLRSARVRQPRRRQLRHTQTELGKGSDA